MHRVWPGAAHVSRPAGLTASSSSLGITVLIMNLKYHSLIPFHSYVLPRRALTGVGTFYNMALLTKMYFASRKNKANPPNRDSKHVSKWIRKQKIYPNLPLEKRPPTTLLVAALARGRSQTTMTRFFTFFDHLPLVLPTPYVDIFYGMNVDQKWRFLDHLPTSSCKRSLWMTPKQRQAFKHDV